MFNEIEHVIYVAMLADVKTQPNESGNKVKIGR